MLFDAIGFKYLDAAVYLQSLKPERKVWPRGPVAWGNAFYELALLQKILKTQWLRTTLRRCILGSRDRRVLEGKKLVGTGHGNKLRQSTAVKFLFPILFRDSGQGIKSRCPDRCINIECLESW